MNEQKEHFSLFGSASALYALFYTFCLYKNASGITYPFFAAGTLFYFCFCMKKCKVPFKKDATFYAVSLLLLGLSVCLTADPKILLMTKTGMFLLTLSFVLHHFYADEKWGLFKHLGAIGHSIFEAFSCLPVPFTDCYVWFTKKEESGARKKWLYVILGLLIGIPLFLLVFVLLMFADEMFEHFAEKLLRGLNLHSFFGIVGMTVVAFFSVYCLMESLLRRRIPEDCREIKKAEPLLAITVTLPIAAVYLLFCGIQIVYLFGRFAQLPAEYTWASYARQGFFQLLAVCLINLILVCFCLHRFRESRFLKGILTAICLMTYIMIASSAYRMILYIQAYYLTFLRFFVLWALALIALIVTGALIALHSGRFFKGKDFPLFRYCMTAVTVCYLCLAFARPDYWIAKYNMAHVNLEALASGDSLYQEEGYQDIRYLSCLSADAAPVFLQEEYQEALLSSCASDSMKRFFNENAQAAEEMSLREFNFSLWAARKR